MKRRLVFLISLGMLLTSCGSIQAGTVSSNSTPKSENTSSSQPTSNPTSSPEETSSQPNSSQGGPIIIDESEESSSTPAQSTPSQEVTDQYLALPFNSYEGSSNPSSTGTEKWTKGFTYRWTFKVSKAIESATLAIGGQMSSSSHGSRTLFTNSDGADSSDTFESNSANDGTPRLSVKANGTSYALTNRSTYSESGMTTSGINYMRLTSFALKEGDNIIEVTTHPEAGYRLMVGGDVRLYYAGDPVVTPPDEPFVPGDGAFSGLTEFTAPVDIHTEKQKAFIDYEGDYTAFTTQTIQEYANGNSNASSPKPVHIEWAHSPKEQSYNYVVEVSQDATFPAAATESYNVKQAKSADLYNFLLGGTYHYRVNCEYGNSKDTSESKSFTITTQAPRNLHIDGITNCRDLGGRVLENGSKFKQGLIYRTAALNSNVAPAGHITEAGKKVLKDVLGVKSEIELRGGSSGTGGEASSETTSDLEGTIFHYMPMAYNGGKNLIYRNIEPIRKIFAVLGNRDNYPVFFHCRIGTDRTGAIALLVNGLIGVSEREIYQDYLFSNFGNIGKQTVVGLGNEDSIDGYVQQIKSFPGNSFADKVYNFLLSIGVPSSDLDTIIDVLTDTTGGTPKTNTPATYETVLAGIESATLTGTSVQSSSAFRSAPKFAKIEASNTSASFTVNVAAGNKHVFAEFQSNVTNVNLSDAFKLTIDGNEVNMPATSFATNSLGFGGDYWIPVELVPSTTMTAGAHTITITGSGTAINLAHIAVQSL